MKSTIPDRPSRQIAPEHLRCIWMTAGLLSYQLCDRQFDCDHCPFDSAIRKSLSGPFASRGDHFAVAPGEPEKENRLHKLLFSRNHCWVGRTGDRRLRVGLAPRLISLLPPVKSVVLPSPGGKVARDNPSFWLVLEDGTLSMDSPVTGTVTRHNASVTNDPSVLSRNLLPDAWLFEVETEASERTLPSLMKREDAEKFYSSDIEKFKNLVITTLKKYNADVGLTAADGGELANEVRQMLGPGLYFEILKKVFHSQY